MSGLAFAPATSTYPEAYRGALFFSDYARSCIWVFGKLSNGDPDPTKIVPLVEGASTPVQLKVGPGGDLYYVDYGIDEDGGLEINGAGVHRITYASTAPTARITADKVSGPAPLTVRFSGATSSDPEGDRLSYTWDLDGNGTYGDATNAAPTRTYQQPGTYVVGLRVADPTGRTGSTTLTVRAGSPPSITSLAPDTTRTWTVGESVPFSATATDSDGQLTASSYRWELLIKHCPSAECHTHPLTGFSGSSGTFRAPDHEYPSHLVLTLTVTDSDGLSASRSVELQPATVTLSWASSPAGGTVTVNGASHPTPYTETFLQGSQLTMTAAPTLGSTPFTSWSDGGARSHEVSAPAVATTYTARYGDPAPPPTALTSLLVRSEPGGVPIKVAGTLQPAPYAAELVPGSVVQLRAPRSHTKRGVRYAFVKWKGIAGTQAKRRRLATVVMGSADRTVVAVYRKLTP